MQLQSYHPHSYHFLLEQAKHPHARAVSTLRCYNEIRVESSAFDAVLFAARLTQIDFDF